MTRQSAGGLRETRPADRFSYHQTMHSRTMRQLLFFLSLLFLLPACQASRPQVEIGGETFYVEIADDNESRAMGLMFRDDMPANHGMLFLFSRPEPRAFWMKNTRIPLDILYFDGDLKLVSMAENTRPCRRDPCPSYPSGMPAQYVLEINGGLASELGIKRGDILKVRNIPGMPDSPRG